MYAKVANAGKKSEQMDGLNRNAWQQQTNKMNASCTEWDKRQIYFLRAALDNVQDPCCRSGLWSKIGMCLSLFTPASPSV